MSVHPPNPGSGHSAETSSKEEPNTNTDNLIMDSCHESYSCWDKGLNGFEFDF